jgi:hypothetical protein
MCITSASLCCDECEDIDLVRGLTAIEAVLFHRNDLKSMRIGVNQAGQEHPNESALADP